MMNKFKGALLLAVATVSIATFTACGKKMDDGDIHVTMTPEQTTASPTASASPDTDILPSMDIDLATVSPDLK